MDIPRKLELLGDGIDGLAGHTVADTPVLVAALRSIAAKAEARATALEAEMQAEIEAALAPRAIEDVPAAAEEPATAAE